LEDVCIHNNSIFEVPTSRSTTTSGKCRHCHNFQQTDLFQQTNGSLHSTFARNYPASACSVCRQSSRVVNEEAIGSVPKGLTRDRLCADKEKELIGSVPMETKKMNVGRSTRQ